LKKTLTKYGFLWFLILLNLGLAAYATPITDDGDAATYIHFSRFLLGEGFEANYAHRSPLYSIILSGFMLLFDAPLLYEVVVFFQYFLIAIAAWMIFLLFQRLFSTKKLSMVAALLFNLSFSTIFYANLIQTEIMTVFFVILSLTFLVKFHEKGSLGHILACGAAIGLLSLIRFNAVPLIFTFFSLLFISLFLQKIPVKKWIFALFSFIIPYLIIINAWCIYNQYQYGFYGLFPHSGRGISRNIIVASIRPEDTVSVAKKPILDIFIEARETYLNTSVTRKKGSFSEKNDFEILTNLYSGFQIYRTARPKLQEYFNLPDSSGEYELSQKLGDFYQEIARQNQSFILKYRFISFFSGFRASASGVLPQEFGKVNLNILPSFVFKVYKLAVIFISLFVFVAFFFFVKNGIKDGWHFNFILLAMHFVVLSFWGINFVFIAAGDANRFKFPAEPLIFGLFIYYAAQVLDWLSKRRRQIALK
jgi:4-amino-4-deoxy-L-arabinose transferase-like glycosyltransferase